MSRLKLFMTEQKFDTTITPISVLLVEDHQLTRLGLKVALHRTSDIRVTGEACNGEEAVLMADSLQPQVILMDVGMPIMDGIQAARRIIAAHPKIRIIMLTQHDNDADIMASLAAGASGYCLKDVDPERLYTAIRSVNAGDAWLDSAIANKVLRHYSTIGPGLAPSASAPDKSDLERTDVLRTELTVQNSSTESTTAPLEIETQSDRPAPDALSARELEVMKLIVDGLSNQEISDRLFVSLATTKTHVRNILNKLAVDDRTQAAVHAMRRGLV
jgi:DNA-binding NarL/FixJ family response regulator